MSHAVEVIGLFPSLDPASIGGIQASGHEAWSGVVARVGKPRTAALCYDETRSRAGMVLRAIRSPKPAATVLVWHLHLLRLLPFVGGARVVLFLHGIEAWSRQDRLTQVMLRKVDLFLSNSDYTWARFADMNPAFAIAPHRTVALGSGSPLTTMAPAQADRPAVLMIGRLDKREDYKGHRQMIAAWPRVLQRISHAQLWIAGDGDLRPALERLVDEIGVGQSVRFFGQVTSARKEQLIGESRCVALPSKGEGFGLVYLEGMRMGRPCLVSDCDAGREVVNPPEAGLAVNPDNLEQVADAVQRMLTPGAEWDDWSTRARARCETRFTADHFRQRLISALFDE